VDHRFLTALPWYAGEEVAGQASAEPAGRPFSPQGWPFVVFELMGEGSKQDADDMAAWWLGHGMMAEALAALPPSLLATPSADREVQVKTAGVMVVEELVALRPRAWGGIVDRPPLQWYATLREQVESGTVEVGGGGGGGGKKRRSAAASADGDSDGGDGESEGGAADGGDGGGGRKKKPAAAAADDDSDGGGGGGGKKKRSKKSAAAAAPSAAARPALAALVQAAAGGGSSSRSSSAAAPAAGGGGGSGRSL
jgi:hypothetical protein